MTDWMVGESTLLARDASWSVGESVILSTEERREVSNNQ